MLETLLALGLTPVGGAEIASYNVKVGTGAAPSTVVDVGLRTSPNLEALHQVRPDCILINPEQRFLRPALQTVARVEVAPIYTAAGDPYGHAIAAARSLAGLDGAPDLAAPLLARAAEAMRAARDKLRSYDARPVLLVNFQSGQHVAVYGGASLFQGVLDQLGLTNGWRKSGGTWGMTRVGIEQLAAFPEARLLYFAPVPPEATNTLARSPMWRHLPFVQADRVIALPALWAFGGLPSAMRIAGLLGDCLGSDHG